MTSTNFSNNQRIYDPLINGDKLPSSCLLCSEGELDKLGHIIPKFVMRWLKRVSKKKEFYLNNKPVKIADTIAIKILCNECEKEFSSHERNFTEKYFKTYYRKKFPIEFSHDIYFFALSIAWRILVSTPMMHGEENSEKHFNAISKTIKTYLLQPDKNVEIDVYVFHADEIAENLPEQHYNRNILQFSISQGIFSQQLKYNDNFIATPGRIPLIYFKLGVYYFIVADQNHLQMLTFPKKIETLGKSKVHVLKYSSELAEVSPEIL